VPKVELLYRGIQSAETEQQSPAQGVEFAPQASKQTG